MSGPFGIPEWLMERTEVSGEENLRFFDRIFKDATIPTEIKALFVDGFASTRSFTSGWASQPGEIEGFRYLSISANGPRQWMVCAVADSGATQAYVVEMPEASVEHDDRPASGEILASLLSGEYEAQGLSVSRMGAGFISSFSERKNGININPFSKSSNPLTNAYQNWRLFTVSGLRQSFGSFMSHIPRSGKGPDWEDLKAIKEALKPVEHLDFQPLEKAIERRAMIVSAAIAKGIRRAIDADVRKVAWAHGYTDISSLSWLTGAATSSQGYALHELNNLEVSIKGRYRTQAVRAFPLLAMPLSSSHLTGQIDEGASVGNALQRIGLSKPFLTQLQGRTSRSFSLSQPNADHILAVTSTLHAMPRDMLPQTKDDWSSLLEVLARHKVSLGESHQIVTPTDPEGRGNGEIPFFDLQREWLRKAAHSFSEMRAVSRRIESAHYKDCVKDLVKAYIMPAWLLQMRQKLGEEVMWRHLGQQMPTDEARQAGKDHTLAILRMDALTKLCESMTDEIHRLGLLSSSQKDIIAASQSWHNNLGQIEAALGGSADGISATTKWRGISEAFERIDRAEAALPLEKRAELDQLPEGVSCVEMLCERDLRVRGTLENHCVGGYTGNVTEAARPGSRFSVIFAINRGDERISTVEFKLLGGSGRFHISQNMAAHNRAASAEGRIAAEVLLRKLNNLTTDEINAYRASMQRTVEQINRVSLDASTTFEKVTGYPIETPGYLGRAKEAMSRYLPGYIRKVGMEAFLPQLDAIMTRHIERLWQGRNFHGRYAAAIRTAVSGIEFTFGDRERAEERPNGTHVLEERTTSERLAILSFNKVPPVELQTGIPAHSQYLARPSRGSHFRGDPKEHGHDFRRMRAFLSPILIGKPYEYAPEEPPAASAHDQTPGEAAQVMRENSIGNIFRFDDGDDLAEVHIRRVDDDFDEEDDHEVPF